MGKHKDKSKKHKKEKKTKRRHSTSSSSSGSEDEWIERPSTSKASSIDSSKPSTSNIDSSPEATKQDSNLQRDDWLSMPTSFSTTTNDDKRRQREEQKRLDREKEKYNPSKSTRELNPYWKDGGDGLPSTFKKPKLDSDDDSDGVRTNGKNKSEYGRSTFNRTSNWRKKKDNSPSTSNKRDVKSSSEDSDDDRKISHHKEEQETPTALTDKEMNSLAAKLIKAEILGDKKLIAELKNKLGNAKRAKETGETDNNDVLLTRTDSKGYSKPVRLQTEYGEGTSKGKGKKRKIETHEKGERVRYFPDDDKYSLKQMFENEKFSSVEDSNNEFMKLAGRVSHNDDLEDVFADKIRRKESDATTDKRNRDRAVDEHQKVTRSLDNCNKCLQSENMPKHLMVSMGNHLYLSLPSHEPLTDGHCIIVPIKHTICATHLDENEWEELMDFRKALTRMYKSKGEDVLFFETANYLNRYPHMKLECVPLPKETGDLAPIYFKKAIDESETEWSSNKKLVSLAGKNVQKAIPKGLCYFSVSFGMDEGYAHVIEDQQLFPNNFAQEIIGGMLDLHHSKWRKPKQETFEEQSKRVLDFSREWNEYNFT